MDGRRTARARASHSERFAVGRPGADDLVAEALVEVVRAVRVLRVHAESHLGHTTVGELSDRLDDERLRNATAAPAARCRDRFSPTALAVELVVLRRVDERLHLTGDPLIVPGDLPERQVVVR